MSHGSTTVKKIVIKAQFAPDCTLIISFCKPTAGQNDKWAVHKT